MNNRVTLLAALALIAAVIAVTLYLRPATADRDPTSAPRDNNATQGATPAIEGSDIAGERRAALGGDLGRNESATPGSPADATLRVRLSNGDTALGSGGITIEMENGSQRRQASIDRIARETVFPGLTPGFYRVSVSTVPTGLLKPRAERRKGEPRPQGVTVVAGENSLTLKLETSARVFGYVHDFDGRLVDGVSVRLSIIEKTWERSVDPIELPVRKGYYEGDAYEGVWMAQVLPWRVASAADAALMGSDVVAPGGSLPIPQVHSLNAGSSTELSFQYEPPASGVVQGTILDELGAPFQGLHVQVNRVHSLIDPVTGEHVTIPGSGGNAVSNETGAYRIAGLTAGEYDVWVEPEGYSPLAQPGGSTVGEVVSTPHIEVLPPTVATLNVQARRPRPVFVKGEIRINDRWASAHGISGRSPSVHVAMGKRGQRLTGSRFDVRLMRNNSFGFWIESSESAAVLEIELGGEMLAYPLTTTSAITEFPLVIDFPQ